METKESFFSLKGSISRGAYFLRFLALLGAFLLIGFAVNWGSSIAAGLTMIVLLLVFFIQSVKRARDAFGNGIWAIALLLPVLNSLALAALLATPSRQKSFLNR